MGIEYAAFVHRRTVAAWMRGVAIVLALASAPPSATDAATSTLEDTHIEAAFLVNFVRYTDWPSARLADPGAPYVVGVVGSADVVDNIGAVAAAAGFINGRRIEVHRIPIVDGARRQDAIDRLRRNHVVFVHLSAADDEDDVLRALRGQPVLTVSDIPGFADAGGMLGLVRLRSHLAFEANPAAIRAAGLLVSAKVLKLARIRQGGDR